MRQFLYLDSDFRGYLVKTTYILNDVLTLAFR